MVADFVFEIIGLQDIDKLKLLAQSGLIKKVEAYCSGTGNSLLVAGVKTKNLKVIDVLVRLGLPNIKDSAGRGIVEAARETGDPNIIDLIMSIYVDRDTRVVSSSSISERQLPAGAGGGDTVSFTPFM